MLLIYWPDSDRVGYAGQDQIQQLIMEGAMPVINSDHIIHEIGNMNLKDIKWEIEEIEAQTEGKDWIGNKTLVTYTAAEIKSWTHADDTYDFEAFQYDNRDKEALTHLVDDRSIPALKAMGIESLTQFMAASDTDLLKVPWITKKSIKLLRQRSSTLFSCVNEDKPFPDKKELEKIGKD